MAELRTRQPTGQVAYPIILVTGEHKKGKSFETYSLAKSDLVGRFFAFELGERTADEYATLAPGRYEIVEHNGTYLDIFEQVKAACAVPQEDGKPNVISLDSGTMFWELHKAYADSLARKSKRGQALLAEDPDAEVDTAMPNWTTTKDRWWAVINYLRAWNGIVIITARVDVVTKVVNGRPVQGETTRSIQIEKGTPFQMTAVVEASFPNVARLTDIQSLNVKIPDGGLELPEDNALEHVIFRIIGAGGAFKSGVIVNPMLGIPALEAKIAVLDKVKAKIVQADGTFDLDEARAIAGKAWLAAGLSDEAEITADQFEAALAELDEPAESKPPIEAEDESQVPPEGEAAPEQADTSPIEAEPEVESAVESAPDPGTRDPEETAPEQEIQADTSVDTSATSVPAAEPEVESAASESTIVETVARADAVAVLMTVAEGLEIPEEARGAVVMMAWEAAGVPVDAATVTQEDLDAVIDTLTSMPDDESESADDVPAPSDATQPAEAPETAKQPAKRGKPQPAAPPTQEALLG